MNTNNLSPEDEHSYLSWQKCQRRGKIAAGIFVVIFGVFYLLNEAGFKMSLWLLTAPPYLIALGIVILIKHNFKKLSGWVLILIGKILILNEFYPNLINTHLIWPIVIILVGLKIIFKPKNHFKEKKWKNIKQNCTQNFQDLDSVSDNDFIESTAFFGGVNKNVVSKNFKGANVMNVFGGTEINLLQAEFEHQAIIDITSVFGGVSLIIPSNWQIKSELVTVFGGIEDKRQMTQNSEIENKILILKGNCVFGGIEIKSFK